MAQCVGIEESAPRLAGRQQHSSNVQAENCSDYYRLNLTIPLLDHLNSELNVHFDGTASQNVTEFMHWSHQQSWTPPRHQISEHFAVLQ